MRYATHNSELRRHKRLALAVVCFFLAAPAPVSAATLPQTVETTVFKNFGLNVITNLRIGTVQAPTVAGSPVIYIIRSDNGECQIPVGVGDCLVGVSQNRSRGEIQITGAPGQAVALTSNLTDNSTSTFNGTDCTGGTGTTPAKLKLIFFNPTNPTLNATTGISSIIGVGGWLVVSDTSAGFQTCAYVINVDFP